jgi:diguanylate cyclase (GGDEF)-like protein
MKGLFKTRNATVAPNGGAADAHPAPLDRNQVIDDFERMGIAWVWASDALGTLSYLSDPAAESLGRSATDLIGRPLASLFVTDPTDDGSQRPLKFQLAARNRLVDQIVAIEVGGEATQWWAISGMPKVDAAGTFHGYRGSARDVTQDHVRKQQDALAAEYDSLTGLANRHRMTRRLDSILSTFQAARRSCALLMLDLDRFKQVNDTMGHPAGDALLRQVAERLRGLIGDRGEIGRLGGDEFQIVLPDLDDRGKLGSLAEKIIQTISQPYALGDGQRAVIGTSIGVAIAPYDGLVLDELVHAADLALYAAKNGGRGQFRFHSADLKDEKEERQILLEDLRTALAEDRLDLHYQPVVRTADSMVVGFEALVRWDHPERGQITPDQFIPIAEESGLIIPLGDWAIRRACEQAALWPATVQVAVNVSAVQFAHHGFPERVAEILAETGLAADRLELELTESVFMGDSEEVDATFRALKQHGVRLALDDFGTGYSSLSYLRSAPFDKLKVDKSFVDACTGKDQNSAKIIAAIIALADAIGMESTVEGVEAFDQLQVVCEKGARHVQGWLYAQAMPQAAVLERMGSGELKILPEGPERYRADRRSVFRRIGVIHDDHHYVATMRNLSRTGARIDGLLGVPVGTRLVVDLGNGQLVVSTASRVEGAIIAVEFETPLVSDGAGGLCTRHRVSPYALAAAGMPLGALPAGSYPHLVGGQGPASKPQFLQVATLGGRN